MKGRDAEQLAETYLLRQGLVLIERNYHCRFGEIDLIMSHENVLVFIEVKMRANDVYGGAVASITATKQAKLLRTARHFLSGLNDVPTCRFDAVLISGVHEPELVWMRNIFDE